ncbi:MAG: hypothetical protein Q9159_001048 [Coniocarpon cinnabarinum]
MSPPVAVWLSRASGFGFSKADPRARAIPPGLSLFSLSSSLLLIAQLAVSAGRESYSPVLSLDMGAAVVDRRPEGRIRESRAVLARPSTQRGESRVMTRQIGGARARHCCEGHDRQSQGPNHDSAPVWVTTRNLHRRTAAPPVWTKRGAKCRPNGLATMQPSLDLHGPTLPAAKMPPPAPSPPG